MMHNSQGFADHVLGLLKNTGPIGPTGPRDSKPLTQNKKPGTSCDEEVGPVGFEWSHQPRASGPGKITEKQTLTALGTSGTSGTSIFDRGAGDQETGRGPAEWHAILAELERAGCPDWLPLDRWELLLSDAENFLSRWGSAAHALGWTALDLYGVHPSAPAARFDVMGLLLLVQGGAVTALTASSASIRRQSGATLTYRRCTAPGAVLLSEVAR